MQPKTFLYGFVREQVEEESTAKEIVDKLKLYGEHHAILLDHELGKKIISFLNKKKLRFLLTKDPEFFML